jgi:hypothetical protein
MLRFRVFLIILSLGFSLHLAAWASTPGLNSVASSGGIPVTPENTIAVGKNPFSIHITLGFPAEIAENKSVAPKPIETDSASLNHTEKRINGSPRIYEYETATTEGTSWHHTSAALSQAMNLDADMVYIHINPFADFNSATTDIRNKLTEYNRPVTVFLDNGSEKEGAIIAVRAEDHSTSGNKPAVKTSVYALEGSQVREKYNTYVDRMLHGDAEKRTDEHTFTTRSGTGLQNTSSVAAVPDLFPNTPSNKSLNNQPLRFSYHPRAFEKMLDFLLLPFISFLLILGMGLGLLFELRNPGRGFPLFAAIFSAVLFFAPLRMDGLAENYEIMLVLTGIGILFAYFIWLRKHWWMPYIGMLCAFTGLLLCLEPSLSLGHFWSDNKLPFLKPFFPVSGSMLSLIAVYRIFLRRDQKTGAERERAIPYAKTESFPG